MSIITISGLEKTYEMNSMGVKALRGIDLAVSRGEFTAIAGPSGSGKTTLLNLIGGLDHPTSGILTVAGSDLNRMSPRELSDIRLNKIGFIFQAYNLIPVLSAVENVEYILLLQGVSREERRDRSRRILEEVGLAKEINRLPKDMSGGQQQRVAVARALANDPPVIIADEPTGRLDSVTAEVIFTIFEDLVRQGKTIIMVTHDHTLARRMTRVVELADGQLVGEGHG